MSPQLADLADALEREQATIDRELEEIGLLLGQTAMEAERYEQRRVQAEELAAALDHDSSSAPEARAEAHTQLISQTRRATLMQGQLDVLGGKQKALQRFRAALATTVPVLRGAAPAGEPQPASGHAASGSQSGEVLAAQEQMRRDIARQMHDGPAQSIANIALQAQIVERLFDRDPQRAGVELEELVSMVQQALDATKAFIFDVRPMVLDDLGLVPTLRRSARERSHRSGIDIRFESVGSDRRLSTEIESGLFRIIEDAVGGFLDVSPIEVVIRLDWSEHALRATVRARPAGADQSAEVKDRAAVAAARRERSMPAALATMVRQQAADEASRSAGLPEPVLLEIEQRASGLGIKIGLFSDRWQLEAVTAV